MPSPFSFSIAGGVSHQSNRTDIDGLFFLPSVQWIMHSRVNSSLYPRYREESRPQDLPEARKERGPFSHSSFLHGESIYLSKVRSPFFTYRYVYRWSEKAIWKPESRMSFNKTVKTSRFSVKFRFWNVSGIIVDSSNGIRVTVFFMSVHRQQGATSKDLGFSSGLNLTLGGKGFWNSDRFYAPNAFRFFFFFLFLLLSFSF